jgi:hypothetical protein
MTNAPHRLFEDFPLSGVVPLSTGHAPTPYHVYDGNGLLICGAADLAAVEHRLKGQDVYPVKTASGRAIMGIFACDFQKASLGPHTELQVSALVSRKTGEVVRDHAFALPAAMVTRPDWGTICMHIWNDTDTVVTYNRDYLGLNPQLGAGKIDRPRGQKSFRFLAPEDGANSSEVILAGQVSEKSRPSFGALFALGRMTGFGSLLRITRQPYVTAFVINMKNSVFPENRRATTYAAPDVNVLQIFDPDHDELTITAAALRSYDFTPLCLQHISPFRFVYVKPEK